MSLFFLLSYALSVWMIVDAYKRGAQSWWWVIIFLPFGEVVYFFVVKIQDFGSGGTTYRHRCRSCQYFANYDEKSGVHCKVGKHIEKRSPSRANSCTEYEKSSWL